MSFSGYLLKEISLLYGTKIVNLKKLEVFLIALNETSNLIMVICWGDLQAIPGIACNGLAYQEV
jgi:hypothetical protein